MKISYTTVIGRLIALVLLANGLTVRAAAHDLPADRCMAHVATSNCLANSPESSLETLLAASSAASSSSAVDRDQTKAASPPGGLTGTFPIGWVPSWISSQATGSAWPGLRNAIAERLSSLSPEKPTPEKPTPEKPTRLAGIAVAHPDQGHAPAPRTLAAKIENPLSDGYLPYDLHRSDWAFKKQSYFAKPAQAVFAPTKLATAKSATAESIALGSALQQFELWQCQAQNWFSQGEELTLLTEKLTKLLVGNTKTLSTPPAPHYAGGPQYIVIETSVGGHIVLTLAQAAHWQFQPTESRGVWAQWLAAAFRPVQDRALAVASQQLEAVGYQLIDLSRHLSGSTEKQIARRAVVDLK